MFLALLDQLVRSFSWRPTRLVIWRWEEDLEAAGGLMAQPTHHFSLVAKSPPESEAAKQIGSIPLW